MHYVGAQAMRGDSEGLDPGARNGMKRNDPMRTKRRPRGLLVAGLCALMPPFGIRCSTPDGPPHDARSGQLETPGARVSIDELRRLVTEHGDLGAHAEGVRPLESFESEYHSTAGRALERLQGAARTAAGPCAAGLVAMPEVDSFDRLAASLESEFDRHRAKSEGADGPHDEEEWRHREGALDLLDELERAYDDVERDARHRASVGCLWYGDV
jgi:hypothetical protein